ncbi:MAG: lanthionine synthetase C family protein [Vitreoscilla sp.]
MLHDPARHEALRPIAWDEGRVRATISHIVDATVAAFSPQALWPPHPRDLEPGDDPDAPATCLYWGASGVFWALDYLTAVGAAAAPSFAGHLDALRERNLAALACREGDNAGSYLMGDLPLQMMAWGHTPTAQRADAIAALIEGNIDHPARELMWGAPGSLLAAALMHGRSGDARWAALFRRIAQRLREQLLWSERQSCHYWSQELYGRQVRYIDAVHGFAATASALIRGRHLLPADDWAEWQRCIETTIAHTAIREEGRASWPVQAEEPPGTAQKWLMQFCHGAPGFVVCLAGLPGTGLDTLLAEAGEATWAAGPLAKGSNLCHGTAGNAYAFLVLHARTGHTRWRDRARAFAMHAIAQFEEETARTGRLRHSLWTGDIGLAIFLFDCLRERAEFPTLDIFFGAPQRH